MLDTMIQSDVYTLYSFYTKYPVVLNNTPSELTKLG